MEIQHLNSSSTLIKITYGKLKNVKNYTAVPVLCICQCIIYSPSQNWDRLCSFPWGGAQEARSMAQTADPQVARGIFHSMECHAQCINWEGTITAGRLRYWASLIFPIVFLCLSPFHYNYYCIFFCFSCETATFFPILLPTLGGEVKPQQTEGYFCLQLCYPQTRSVSSLAGFFSCQQGEDLRNPLRLSIHLSTVYKAFKGKYPPGKQGALVGQLGKKSSIPASSVRHCLLCTSVQNNLQRADTTRWGEWWGELLPSFKGFSVFFSSTSAGSVLKC